MTTRGIVGVVAVTAVGAAIAAGLAVMERPSEARARRLDTRRVADLVQLQRDVEVYRERRASPPASLDELASEAGLGLRRTDPETDAMYGYRVVDETHVELCADFATGTTQPATGGRDQFWAHGAGHQCFTVDVSDTERRQGR